MSHISIWLECDLSRWTAIFYGARYVTGMSRWASLWMSVDFDDMVSFIAPNTQFDSANGILNGMINTNTHDNIHTKFHNNQLLVLIAVKSCDFWHCCFDSFYLVFYLLWTWNGYMNTFAQSIFYNSLPCRPVSMESSFKWTDMSITGRMLLLKSPSHMVRSISVTNGN